jgi:hypothetical protein
VRLRNATDRLTVVVGVDAVHVPDNLGLRLAVTTPMRRRPRYAGAAIVGNLSAGLSECESQQARAQHHKAGCGQREKSVGNKVVITHDTPATLDARPN